MSENVEESVKRVLQVFSERDMEFNRKMIKKGNEASGFVRHHLKVDSLGGKVLRYNPQNQKDQKENEYDILGTLLKEYFGE